MKKTILLFALLFQLTVCFGQNHEWGPWTSVSCFKGIQYSIMNLGYNKVGNFYYWNVRWKNNYSQPVSFDGEVVIGSEHTIWGRWGTLQPGGIQGTTVSPYTSGSSNFIVNVSKVCFADKNGGCSEYSEGSARFAECDNGTPNYSFVPKKSANKTPQSNASTNSSLTTASNSAAKPQNDLTEYNRSKQQLEDEMSRKNAEIQRQNLQNANRLQIYNNAIKAGVDAHNTGNYDEAKNQFTTAINNSNTEQDRKQAQDYYNKTAGSEKSIARIQAVNQVANVITDAVNVYQKAKAEQKESERIYQEKIKVIQDEANERQKQQEQDSRNEIALANNNDTKAQESLLYKNKYQQNYEQVEYWSKKILSNTSNINSTLSLDLIRTLSILGKKNEAIDSIKSLFLRKNGGKKRYNFYNYDDVILSLILINNQPYFGKFQKFDDPWITNGINTLRTIADSCRNKYIKSFAGTWYAYYQVTGELESVGLSPNVQEGLQKMKAYNENKEGLVDASDAASYLLGTIYYSGTKTVEKNEKLAFEYLSKLLHKDHGKVDSFLYDYPGAWFAPELRAYYLAIDRIENGDGTKKNKDLAKSMKYKLYTYLNLLTEKEKVDFLTKNCWMLSSGCPYKP